MLLVLDGDDAAVMLSHSSSSSSQDHLSSVTRSFLRNNPEFDAVSTGSNVVQLRRSTAGDLEDPKVCFSLRENDDQRQLLCNDRRSNFNFNPFGLRFGKRYDGYVYRRAIKRARTNTFYPLFPRQLEGPI